MSVTTHSVDDRDASSVGPRASLSATGAIAAVLALAGLVVGIAAARSLGDARAYSALVLLGAWSAATLVVAFRRSDESLAAWLAIATTAGAAALVTDRLVGTVPYALAALSAALPTGAITGRRRRHSRRGDRGGGRPS